MKRTLLLISFSLITFIFSLYNAPSACGQVITSKQVDELAERTLKAFAVPGMAVAIIKDGKVIHAKGYGVRSLKTKEKVDANTLFGIASNTKAFTAASLGLLVDEGKLNWDDKVVKYIPEFRLYNDYVTQEFTIRDLITHRSGLGLGAGDLMFFPNPSNFKIEEVIYNLRYLKPVSAFRTKYDYDNLLYMVAGEVVHRLTGKPWGTFVEEQIMQPLQMTKSAASWSRLKDTTNVIAAHAPVAGKVQVIKRHQETFGSSAGGIYSSIADMSKWVIMQLNHGKYGEGQEKQLFSEAVHEEMWTPQTIIPVTTTPPYNSHFGAYGLGWFLTDVKGYKQAMHTGGLEGMVTQVTLIPELQLGIIVFTNQQAGAAFNAVTSTIKDSYLGIPPTDRVKQISAIVKASEAEAAKISADIWSAIAAQEKKNKHKVDLKPYTGTYHDNWFGDIIISLKDGKLWFDAKRSPRLTGEVFPYQEQTFILKWQDRSFDADAFVTFVSNEKGQPVGIKMKPISPLTDFSYDFQDLDFQKVK